MDDDLKKFMENDAAFSEMKNYLVDYMASNTHVITPEEGFMAMKGMEYRNEELYKEFIAAQNDFFARFWTEKLIGRMDKEAFDRFLRSMSRDLGGDPFFVGLKTYLNKHFTLVRWE